MSAAREGERERYKERKKGRKNERERGTTRGRIALTCSIYAYKRANLTHVTCTSHVSVTLDRGSYDCCFAGTNWLTWFLARRSQTWSAGVTRPLPSRSSHVSLVRTYLRLKKLNRRTINVHASTSASAKRLWCMQRLRYVNYWHTNRQTKFKSIQSPPDRPSVRQSAHFVATKNDQWKNCSQQLHLLWFLVILLRVKSYIYMYIILHIAIHESFLWTAGVPSR